jgi:hypothetical protein
LSVDINKEIEIISKLKNEKINKRLLENNEITWEELRVKSEI